MLPAIYRERDVELGEPLRALLRTIQEQATLVESDIRRLWDNFFIETCEPWVISYISYEAENVQARRLGAAGDFRSQIAKASSSLDTMPKSLPIYSKPIPLFF